MKMFMVILEVFLFGQVSTLFEEEEESSIFPLKEASVDLSCPINTPTTQEEMAQSAHLMSLGLCRISAHKPPPPLPAPAPPHHPSTSQPVLPPPDDSPVLSQSSSLQQSDTSRQLTTSPSRLLCLLCPLTLPTRRLLDVHVRSHQASGGFGCVCCSWTANSWEELEPHWRSHSRKRRRKRREEQEQEEKKKKKKKKKAASRSFGCRNIQQQTQSACDQRRHGNLSDRWRRRLIGRAGGKDVARTDSRCEARSAKSITEMQNKTRQQKTEEEEKEGFCCSLCHRKFSTKLTLKRHLGVHGGEKPFTCPHCSYSSRLKASLLQHLRTHTGEKPYRCAQCPYASIDRSSLLRHGRTHSQEKPYRCQHCDYCSIQKKSLDLHARRHHTGEAFPCQQCEYSSPDRQLLLRHIRRHHASSQHATL